ncbi:MULTISPECIES: polyprenyl synthetase family protein [unclassified Dietzia]|uniref:polyprenyl synthetase family protein n=1 Tax=unclassified Dietzia TaxID=2617939 RepID=UPI000D21DF9E|nr:MULTISPECIES: polyprenyl synthetase family protein [unclassified Dietzia]AVZ39152.1 geranylgeranyl pyrophosphate synthase [Dietzia sp. JS16-p6b]MBB1024880.1 polyprenyl synthetase family protein [Dietzia sp. DQ12-76]MBB1028079.1 polyprenyl synthetase family protein [Dietzia sp. DQ11-38-2]QGW24365.1 putative polyprenyl synthase [Dietzia sp. DQ12-45-1b]
MVTVVTATRPDDAQRVLGALRRHLDERRRVVSGVDDRVDALAGRLSDFVLNGGKRIRPRFGLAGWSAASPADATVPDEILTACAALELIQACALIHDDIVDASDTRRGRPTVHRSIEATHRDLGWSGDPARYGVSQAILVGDLALAWADEMFVTSGVDPTALGRALEPWYAMKTEVLSGQMLDILAESSGATDEETPARVNRFKTAAYTVERPLHIGAALAGAEPGTVTALREFGVAVGQAFQLRDDMLGVFGDPEVTGKPSGDDLREGKRTLLLARGTALAPTGEAEFLLSVLGTDLDPADLERARRILVDCGAVASVEAEIDTFTVRALDAIGSDAVSEHGRVTLRALAEAATRRRS